MRAAEGVRGVRRRWIRFESAEAAGWKGGGGFRYWVREDRFRLSGGARIVQGD